MVGLEHPTFHLRGEDVSTSPPPLPKRCCLIHCNSLPLIRIFIPQLFYSGGLKKEHKIKIASQIQSRVKIQNSPICKWEVCVAIVDKIAKENVDRVEKFREKNRAIVHQTYNFHQSFTSPTTSSFHQCDFTFSLSFRIQIKVRWSMDSKWK